jgi:hypothetical protein
VPLFRALGGYLLSANKAMQSGLIKGGAVALFVNGLLFAWIASSSFSWGISPQGSELVILLVFLCPVFTFIGFVVALIPKFQIAGRVLLGSSLIFVILCLLALWLGNQVRMLGFEQFAEHSKSLIHAINSYTNIHGEPPHELSELVPEYLQTIPNTGVGQAPNYLYLSGPEASKGYDGNPWVLWLDVPTGIINWDIIIYYPLQNYPEFDFGGSLELVGEWAYVVE